MIDVKPAPLHLLQELFGNRVSAALAEDRIHAAIGAQPGGAVINPCMNLFWVIDRQTMKASPNTVFHQLFFIARAKFVGGQQIAV